MMQGLNPPQREAIRYLDGPLLVLAGAGSGKTRVITHKIAYLVEECQVQPAHIAAITFTNKAAREMQERVATLLPGRPLQGLTLSTFHALGARILRQEARICGLKPAFSIFDASDSAAIIAELLGNPDKARIRAVQGRISMWKNNLAGPEQALATAQEPLEMAAARLYAEYDRSLHAYQAVDFDDLIRLPAQLLETEAEVLMRWQGRLRHLLVDEYQDTNRCQYRLLQLLAGTRASFTAVGDDDQSIYAWRGADVENLNALQRDFPRLKVIKLEQNYRSTTRILKAANSLISHNPKLFEKRLWSDHGHGDAIQGSACRDGEHEAELVAMKLMAHKFDHRGQFRDYAILYRGNHQARAFEQQLRNHRIPYVLSGGQSYFDRAEIKDLIAYLRLISNGDDDPAFIRAVTTPKRGIGGATLEALGAYAGQRHASLFAAAFEAGAASHVNAKQLQAVREFGQFINRMESRAAREPAGQVLEDLVKAIGYESWLFESCEAREAETKWANVRDCVDWLSRKGEEEGKNLLELTQTVALISMLEKNDTAGDTVQLATLHAAKGLEFKHVFLVGVEEGILPHRDAEEEGRIEEERRLMYVGITRAERSLHLSWCERRKLGKEWRNCEPSRFIVEMNPGGDDLKISGGKTATPPDKAAGRAKLARFREMLGGA
ncbi:MAG: UvrD-helicase domain-containing protein [Proteobacteria bacterium]|nr:UvrD-helicase domain-containing protein [Pseudomonadota bacterium]